MKDAIDCSLLHNGYASCKADSADSDPNLLLGGVEAFSLLRRALLRSLRSRWLGVSSPLLVAAVCGLAAEIGKTQ